MNKKNLLNIVIMQVGWWSITLNAERPKIYITATLVLLGLHLILCRGFRGKELIFILISTLIGGGADYLAIHLQFFQPTVEYSIFPIWLICYWLLFGTSFSFSLNWLKSKGYLASILVFVFAPLTYYAGERFGLLTFNSQSKIQAVISYGVLWAMIYPALFKVHTKVLSR